MPDRDLLDIIHVLPATPFGGVQVVLLDLARAQQDHGHNVRVLFTNQGDQASALVAESGLSIMQFGTNRMALAARMAAALRRDRKAIVHSHCEPFWASMILALACPSRWVVHLHVYPDSRASLRKSAANWLQSTFAKHFIAISESVRTIAVERGLAKPEHINVAYNGISAPPAAVTHSCDPRGRLRIGFVGRVVREKGIFELISCAEQFRDCDDVTFTVFGQGEALAEAMAQVAAMRLDHKVEFRGFVSDMAAVWGAIDVLAMLSVREPFGLVVLEAIANGVAVIGYRNQSGGAELLEQLAGGYLLERWDIAAFGRLVEDMKLNREGMEAAVAKGARVVRETFSRAAMERRVSAVYQKTFFAEPVAS